MMKYILYILNKLKFTAFIDNKSNLAINEINVRLIQNLKFKARSKTKNCSRVVKQVNYPSNLRARSAETWIKQLPIPPVCPDSNDICRIVKIKYRLVLTLGAADSNNFDLLIPVTIGSVPLRNEIESSYAYQFASDFPPSYEACMFRSNLDGGNVNPDFENGEIIEHDFKPLYPVYRDTNVKY